MKKLSFVFGFLIIGAIISSFLFWLKLPDLKASVFEVLKQSQEANLDSEKWQETFLKAKELPAVYPVTKLKKSILEIEKIFGEIGNLKNISSQEFGSQIEKETVLKVFSSLKKIEKSISKIEKNIDTFPEYLMDEEQKKEKEEVLARVKLIQQILSEFSNFSETLNTFFIQKERVLILLQNQNEPRPTGGFAGSCIILDFDEHFLTWKFSDIYAIDRKIPVAYQLPAPTFFHGLSKTISLRDANFWPDFPKTANAYREFFRASGEKRPSVVVGINMNFINEILKITGKIVLPKWGITVNENNFDVVLQFLVESKIAGRFGTKTPVLDFAKAIFDKLKRIDDVHQIVEFDIENFLARKNIMAFAESRALQKLFDKWGIAGRLQRKNDTDNFLHLDFVSIGANKSDKFVWTKLRHDSNISKEGVVHNTLKITRNFVFQKGEIESFLNIEAMSPNIKNLLNEELIWKLGAGQNRVMIRAFVPYDAKFLSAKNQAGEISETFSENGKFKILEIPAFISPGEKLDIAVEYETKITRGSQNWRPYFLQFSLPSGRQKTEFLETISTAKGGSFLAETDNIGRPINDLDADFRAVIEFP
jgi:hypothetical protein